MEVIYQSLFIYFVWFIFYIIIEFILKSNLGEHWLVDYVFK